MSIDLENMLSHERKRVEFIQLKRCLRSDLSIFIKRDGTRDFRSLFFGRFVIASDSQKLKPEMCYDFNRSRY